MTTHLTPAPDNHISPDTLPPQDAAYLARIERALRCGVPGCSCAEGLKVHCPSHDNAAVPTLTITYDEQLGFSFECTRCPSGKVWDALAKRGLTHRSHLYTSTGAVEAGLDPFAFFIQQPQDWLWPNRIPLGKLTLIAGYPSSGKTSIALDIAARVSRGAPAPDQPDAPFPAAPVVLAPLNANPKADVLPTLRLFGADLDFIYLADLLSPTHPLDYYPGEPPRDHDDEEEDDWGRGFDDDPELRGTPLGRPAPITGKPRMFPLFGEPPPVPAPKLAAPWPGLNHVMGRLANYIEAGSAALLVVDQVEDLALMHRAQVATVLGMLKALAARSGAAVIALSHNPAQNYPRAVTAMQRRLAQASVVFTTALVEPGGRRFLVPLRPALSNDAPAIPFVLPPPPPSLLRRQEPRSPSLGLADDFTVAWRKPVLSVFQSTQKRTLLMGGRIGCRGDQVGATGYGFSVRGRTRRSPRMRLRGCPRDFPQRLERFREESGLSWKPRVSRGCRASAPATAAGKLSMTHVAENATEERPRRFQPSYHVFQPLAVCGPDEAVPGKPAPRSTPTPRGGGRSLGPAPIPGARSPTPPLPLARWAPSARSSNRGAASPDGP